MSAELKSALRECQQAIEAFIEFGKNGGDTSWQNHGESNPQSIFYNLMVANENAVKLLSDAPTKYTVCGLCLCGCDNSFVTHTDATDAEDAERKVVQKRLDENECSSRVVAVFEGHLEDICEFVTTEED